MRDRTSRVEEVVRAVVHEARVEKITFMPGSIAYHAFLSIDNAVSVSVAGPLGDAIRALATTVGLFVVFYRRNRPSASGSYGRLRLP